MSVSVCATWDNYIRMWSDEVKVKKYEEAMSLRATQQDPRQVALEQVGSFRERA